MVGEAPGPEDVLQGKAFVGRSGQELETGLARLGIQRSQVSLTHTLLCRPEDNDIKRMLKGIKARNKARKERGEPQLLTPLDYCRPRLLNELRQHHYVVAMGMEAHQACTGLKEPILRVRGTMQRLLIPEDTETGAAPHTVKYLPTVHPVMVSRVERWRVPFRSDLAKAWRYFNDALDWEEPELIYNPPPDVLRKLLLTEQGLQVQVRLSDSTEKRSHWSTPRFPAHIEQGKRWHAYDVETQHKLSSLDARMRCLAIGTPQWSVVVSVTTIEETRRWWSEHNRGQQVLPERQMVYGEEWAEVVAILDEWARDPEIVKVGWNSGYYDAGTWFQWRGYKPAPALDLILAWRDCASELPKGLGFVGTLLLDAPDWKGDHTATQTNDDAELWRYNGFDTCITARLVEPVLRLMQERGQGHHLSPNHGVQAMCLDMHRNGLWVSQERRARAEGWLGALRSSTEITCKRIAAKYGLDKHNPRSFPQVANLLYDVWDYLPPYETDAGEPSTGEDALLALLRDRRCTDEHREYIEALILHRNVGKRHSTYCKPMRREDRWWRAKDDAERWYTEAAQLRGQGDLRHGRVMLSDLRLHPGYSAHCYSADTEILTERGWVLFSDLDAGDRVAQWDEGAITFVQPLAYLDDPFEGEMVHYQNRYADLQVTPHHRMLVRSVKTGRLKEIKADEMPDPTGPVSGWQSVGAGEWAGGSGLRMGTEAMTEAEIRCMVAVQADAHIHRSAGIRLRFRKERKIRRIQRLLREAGVTYREAEKGHFYVPASTFTSRMKELLGASTGKRWGSWLLKCSRQQVEWLLDELWFWDGCADRRTQYASKHASDTGWMQALMALSGRRSTTRSSEQDGTYGRHVVHVLGRSMPGPYTRICRGNTRKVPYKGRVYCVTVPSGWVVVRRNGRVSVSGNTVVSHRLSSTAINAQNIEKVFRYLIIPQPLGELMELWQSGWLHVLWGRLARLPSPGGPQPAWMQPGDDRFERIFVGADMDQLELRVSAAMADCDSYLQVFKDGGDPHAITARLLFGDAFLRELKHKEKTGKKTGAFTAMRDTAKVFVYLVTYGGSAETAWKGITAFTDHKGARPYAHMKLETVVKYRNSWLKGAPEYERWWGQTQFTFRRHGFLSDPVDGVRRDFLDGENFNELVNHSVQAAGYAVVRRATERLLEAFPQDWCWQNWGPGTGLVTQTHDANMAEVPRYAAERYRDVMEDCMTLRVPGLDVPFTAEARLSPDWANAC